LKHAIVSLCLLVIPAIVTAQVPRSNHVVVVVEENHSYSSVIGNSAMPYLNSLATKYGLATQYYANTHPSIGNYFEMTTGQIITNNDGFSSTVTADNIVRHMLTAGKTWKSYAESLPYTGYTGGDVYPYSRHHNPFSYFSDVVNSSVEKLNLVPFTHFATDLNNNALPDLSFIIPNKLDDAHDGTLAQADYWLKTRIGPLLSNAEFQKDGILIIVFDESFDSDTAHGGGHIAAVVVGPKVKKGFKSTTFYQHQYMLRTVMEALGMSTFPGSAANVYDMRGMFVSTSTSTSTSTACTALTNGVTVCSPTSGSTVASPAHVSAAAKSSLASITGMRVYVDGISVYATNAASINTYISMATGTHSMVVQAWDATGAVYKNSLSIKVQ
jgi:phosphatidylinositol-3-phosphatase